MGVFVSDSLGERMDGTEERVGGAGGGASSPCSPARCGRNSGRDAPRLALHAASAARSRSAPASQARTPGFFTYSVEFVPTRPEDDTIIRPMIDVGLRDFQATGDEDHDVGELTRLIMRSMEGAIRAILPAETATSKTRFPVAV